MAKLSLPAILIAGHVCCAVSICQPTPQSPAQQSANPAAGTEIVIGDLISIDQNARTATAKTKEGTMVLISLEEGATCLRLPGGETSLAKAVPTHFAEAGVGDRVLAKGRMSEDRARLLARLLVVLTKADIEKKRERDIKEWKQRGIAGTVKTVHPETGELIVETHTPRGSVIAVSTENASFWRYAPGSANFEDSKSSAFAEVKVGDQLRALGERGQDGKSFRAEQIVSGSFQTIGCVVTNVDSEKNRIEAKTLVEKRPIVVSIGKETALHRVAPETIPLIAKAIAGTPASAGSSSGADRNIQKPTQSSGQKAAQDSTGQDAARKKGTNEPLDVGRLFDALPIVGLDDIKRGEVLAVAGTFDNDNSHITAIKLFAGVDGILKAIQAQSSKRQVINLSAGLPAGAFDFVLGPP